MGPARFNRFLSVVAGFMLGLITVLVCGCTSTAQEPPPPADPNLSSAEPSHRWPKVIDAPEGQITVYQPQLTKFEGDLLSARAAVSVVPPGQQDPVFGAIWMESRVAVDRAARTVQILDVNVTRTRFPGGGGVSEQAMTAALQSTMPQQPLTLSLDQLLTMLEVVQKEKAAVKEIATEPPAIIFRDHPALLLRYDGPPRLRQVADSNLMRAINTPFFVMLEPTTRTYFLKGAGQWFAAPEALGPFHHATEVPASVISAADADGYKDPQQPLPPEQAAQLEIIATSDPAELIWTDGPEEMGTMPGTDLLYVTNTASTVFLEIQTQQIYVLLSGRWFTANSRNGPWAFVPPDKLPQDFKLIPPDSDKADALAHIAGTQAARDAVADTFVPQTAAIDRRTFDPPVVEYDGDPNFQPIEGTPCTYAVNSPASIIFVRGQYYCCANAVWYTCPSPSGPWGLCTSVPEEIYTIPPSCPVYSVRYVYVYQVTPEYVYCGYLPGYEGCYPYNGVVVYGTGYHYQPWEGRHFYGRPWTYGLAAHYDAYENHWGFATGFGAGGGRAWLGEREDSEHRGTWFGHGGYRTAEIRNVQNINIRQTIVHQTIVNENFNTRSESAERNWNVYQRRKDVRQDVPSRTVSQQRNPGPERQEQRPIGPSRPAAPSRVDTRSPAPRNDVLVDPSGDVYRKTLDGWEHRENNRWVPSDRAGASQGHTEVQPAHPSANEPGRNGTAEPRRAEPVQSRNTGPAEPGRVEPTQPGKAEPGGPRNIGPTEPKNAAPVEPRRTEPTEPRKAQPSEPGRVEPGEPRRTAPVEPGKTEPPAPRKTEPAEPKNPQPHEPAHTAPPAEHPRESTHGDLNQEYHARVAGEQRGRNAPSEPPARAPAPAHAPAPPPAPANPAPAPSRSAPAGGGNSGGGGGGGTGNQPPGPGTHGTGSNTH